MPLLRVLILCGLNRDRNQCPLIDWEEVWATSLGGYRYRLFCHNTMVLIVCHHQGGFTGNSPTHICWTPIHSCRNYSSDCRNSLSISSKRNSIFVKAMVGSISPLWSGLLFDYDGYPVCWTVAPSCHDSEFHFELHYHLGCNVRLCLLAWTTELETACPRSCRHGRSFSLFLADWYPNEFFTGHLCCFHQFDCQCLFSHHWTWN